jgi:hypothetical protein
MAGGAEEEAAEEAVEVAVKEAVKDAAEETSAMLSGRSRREREIKTSQVRSQSSQKRLSLIDSWTRSRRVRSLCADSAENVNY